MCSVIWKAAVSQLLHEPNLVVRSVVQNNNFLMIYNSEIMPRSDGRYQKKPDVFIVNKTEKEAYIIDVTKSPIQDYQEPSSIR